VAERRLLRIFISSPSDVRPERLIAVRVVERLAREFAHHFRVEPVMWEREPLVAGQSFQSGIVPPRETDIVAVIVWSRLGVLLPADEYRGAISGHAVTGTEWEFEDALASFRERRQPDVLLYRKVAEVTASLSDESIVQERLAQIRAVDDFITRWTRSADGQSFTSAYWTFESASAFEELLHQHLTELLRRRLTTVSSETPTVRWHAGSPFRGLQAFHLSHAAVFFGRTQARNELREILAKQDGTPHALLLVMGASGSGKSSLVQAGLLADLKTPGMVGRVALCRHAIMRPGDGDDPVGALAAALLTPTALPELSTLAYDGAALATVLRAGGGPVEIAIRQGLSAAGQAAGLTAHAESRLLLIVDQLEELFTRDSLTDADRAGFVASLEALAATRLVWIVATLRSDFFAHLQQLPGLLALAPAEARYVLSSPKPSEIAQMVRFPAREAGLRFEVDAATGIGLDDTIEQAASRNAAALPLLSFLLDQLWQLRTESGTLTYEAYRRLGGLEGSLGRRAAEVFEAQSEDVRRALPDVIRALVTVTPGAGVATSRSAKLSDFPQGTPRRQLLDALLDPSARLVVIGDDTGAGPQVRVAHEALVSHWEAARQQVVADMRDLELRARLDQAAQLWREAEPQHRASLLLASGLPLDEARDLAVRWPSGLDSATQEFITASRKAAFRRRARLTASVAGALVAIPLVASLVWVFLIWQGVRAVEAGLNMVRIEQDCFDMGSTPADKERDPDEGPVHRVCLQPFELSAFEVTQRDWVAVMRGNPSAVVGDTLPVDNVTWNDTQRFIRRMNWFGRREYRLPSEAEWEYAARAGATTAYQWGAAVDPEGCRYANVNDRAFATARPQDPVSPQAHACNDGHYQSSPVGTFRPNKFGLYDMHGNIWEWVQDAYHPNYRDAPGDGRAWEDLPGARRVFRGGGWHSIGRRLRWAERDAEPADYKIVYNGFRLAATVRR
jgi:formylglycine-generating enzyme required for sulfatase activity